MSNLEAAKTLLFIYEYYVRHHDFISQETKEAVILAIRGLCDSEKYSDVVVGDLL